VKPLLPALFFITCAAVIAAMNPSYYKGEPGTRQLAIVGATLLDPKTGQARDQTILIQGERIVALLPPDEDIGDKRVRQIDARGKWIVPGFIDAHAHGWGDASPIGMATPFGTLGSAKRYLYAGVTAYLDLFSSEDDILALRDHQRHSMPTAATIFAAGPCFTATRGHCSEYGTPTRLIDTPEEARQEVQDLIRTGRPDVIKIVYDHNFRQMPTIDRETLEAAISAARELSIKTVIHIGTWQDALDAINAQADAVTHTFFEEIPDELAALMAEKKTFYIPTLAVQTELLNIVKDPTLLDSDLLVRMVGSRRDAYRDESLFSEMAMRFLAYQRRGEGAYFKSVAKAQKAGVRVLVGTDSGNLGVFQGYSVHREMALLVEAGLTPWEALRAATTNAGEFFQIDNSLNVGALADLAILDRSPLVDIRNSESVSGVVLRGAEIDRDCLFPGP